MIRGILCWVLLLGVLVTSSVYGQEEQFSFESKPRWEAGLAAGYFNGVDYPGSTDPNITQLVLPYFIYRSEVVRVGDGGAGAVAIEQPRLKLDVSFGGSLNAESETGSVRAGMPDLDLLFEFGPRLQYKIFQQEWQAGASSELTWDSKLRAVFATDFKSVQAQGFVFSTGISLVQRGIATEKVNLLVSTDVTFGDRRYNDYFYSVSSGFSTEQRPSYNASAGYVEGRLFVGVAVNPVPALNLFTGVALFNYANSANENSPLFETETSTQYVVGIAWSALRSKEFIDVYKSTQ